MDVYLQNIKESLVQKNYHKWHVILGTEACDLDSAVSSVVYAYLLTKLCSDASKVDTLFLPILNIHRSSLITRRDIAHSFQKINIPLDLLPCKNEINLKELASSGKLELTLVDHNILAPQDKYLENYVSEIIDHHKDERIEKHKNVKTRLEAVGSCATLIAEEFFNKASKDISKEIASLLYDTILLDTINFSPEAKKGTPLDEIYVTKLEAILNTKDRNQTFLAAQNAKFDVTGLSFSQLLTRDLKVAANDNISVAVPSVAISLKNVPDVCAQLETFVNENNFDVIVVVGITCSEETVKRELLVYSASPRKSKDLIAELKEVKDPSLNLKQIATEVNSSRIHLFSQGNTTASRKVILPVIRSFIDKI